MPYESRASQKTPSCIIFLLNMGNTMDSSIDSTVANRETKKQASITAINRFIEELFSYCIRQSKVLDRFYVGVAGYQNTRGGTILVNNFFCLPASRLSENVIRFENTPKSIKPSRLEKTEHIESMPIWMEPNTAFNTAIAKKFESIYQMLSLWVAEFPMSFPPVLIHLTDNKTISEEILSDIRLVKSIETQDGQPLVFNCVITNSTNGRNIFFPNTAEKLTDETVSRRLFEESSILPIVFARKIYQEYRQLFPDSRCFALVSNSQTLNSFLATILRSLPMVYTPSLAEAEAAKEYDRTMNIIIREKQESRALGTEKRSKQSHVISIIAIVVSILGFIITMIKFFMGK